MNNSRVVYIVKEHIAEVDTYELQDFMKVPKNCVSEGDRIIDFFSSEDEAIKYVEKLLSEHNYTCDIYDGGKMCSWYSYSIYEMILEDKNTTLNDIRNNKKLCQNTATHTLKLILGKDEGWVKLSRYEPSLMYEISKDKKNNIKIKFYDSNYVRVTYYLTKREINVITKQDDIEKLEKYIDKVCKKHFRNYENIDDNCCFLAYTLRKEMQTVL